MPQIETNNGTTTITYPAWEGVRPGTFRSAHTIVMEVDGKELSIKPPIRAYKAARKGEVYVLTGKEFDSCIRSAKANNLKMERFRTFCKEDGIPEDGRLIHENGTVDVYCPDAMGYPTLVLKIDTDGEVIDD